jgi:hypothetical protein
MSLYGEPRLTTDPALLDVLKQLMDREPIFHRPEFGTLRSDFERMVSSDFWEVGASGHRYRRNFVLDELEKRHSSPVVERWAADDFHCLELAPDLYLLTYTLIMDDRITRRSTIWKRDGDEWKIVYHQGTVVTESGR